MSITINFSAFLIFQLIAHFLADYTFQKDNEAIDKNEKGFKSVFLKKHILLVFVFSWLLSFDLNFVFGSLIIAILHYIIDGFRPKINQNKHSSNYSFFLDQALHLATIVATTYFYFLFFKEQNYIDTNDSNAYFKNSSSIILVFLFCTKPTNIIIKEIMKSFNVVFTHNDDLPNAGKLIGITERFLILIFMLINQFEAVGFLLAAKSILRYKEENNEGSNKTEYVLIGTLLSFGLSIACVIVVKFIENWNPFLI